MWRPFYEANSRASTNKAEAKSPACKYPAASTVAAGRARSSAAWSSANVNSAHCTPVFNACTTQCASNWCCTHSTLPETCKDVHDCAGHVHMPAPALCGARLLATGVITGRNRVCARCRPPTVTENLARDSRAAPVGFCGRSHSLARWGRSGCQRVRVHCACLVTLAGTVSEVQDTRQAPHPRSAPQQPHCRKHSCATRPHSRRDGTHRPAPHTSRWCASAFAPAVAMPRKAQA